MTLLAPSAGLMECPGLTEVPTLVNPEVSRRKVRRFLNDWEQQRRAYRRRGWLILDVYDDLVVDVAVATRLPGFTPAGLDVVPACFRVDYRNFDFWPPSVTFIDLLTRTPTQPAVRALLLNGADVRDVLVDGHPATGLPFLCLPGTREYHDHPQHSGDDWLLYRSQGDGNLAVVADRVWRSMVQNVQGVGVFLQAFNPPVGGQLTVQLLQLAALPPPAVAAGPVPVPVGAP